MSETWSVNDVFPMSAPGRKYIPKRSVAQRYGVTPRTVDRWKKANIFCPRIARLTGASIGTKAVWMTTIANWSLSLPQPQNETGRLLRGRQPGREII